MSDNSNSSRKGSIATRLRRKVRKSVSSDEDDSVSKRRTRSSSARYVESSSEESEHERRTSRSGCKPPWSRPQRTQARLVGGAQRFVKDDYEPARDRFLEENSLSDDSSGWIVDDDEGEGEDNSEADSDNTPIEDSDGSESAAAGVEEGKAAADVEEGKAAAGVEEGKAAAGVEEGKAAAGVEEGIAAAGVEEGKAVAKGDQADSSDEETVSPCKKSRSQRIHSDDSEASGTPPANGQESDNQSECKRRKKKRKRRRVVMLPDEQDMDEQANDSESGDSIVTLTSNDDLSDFIVDDDESVAAEDGSVALMYPREEYFTSASKLMDRKQAFTVVMESMLLHALDPDYFKSREFRKDKDIASAFNKVFAPLTVLLNDVKSQAWCVRFSNALQYREMSSRKHHSFVSNTCEACCRGDRYASHKLHMSGRRHDKDSLEPLESDAADSDDDADDESTAALADKTFLVGKYCLKRAEIYHEVLHFKLSLLETCQAKVNKDKYKEQSADAIVEELIIEKPGWIDPQYRIYSSLLDKTGELIRRRSGVTRADESFG